MWDENEEFLQKSLVVNHSVNFETWELLPIIQNTRDAVQEHLDWNIWIKNDNGRIIWEWWVEKVRFLLNWLKGTKWNSSVDIESESFWIEVKTCRLWNATIIRWNQLENISTIESQKKYYYALIYYKRKKSDKSISKLTQDEIKKELKVKNIYIFPLE
jgi:hypothetical protein